MRDTVTVRVPATTANLGPGYDVFGMALSVWMDVTISKSDAFGMEVEGEGADDVSLDKENIIVQSCELGFKMAKVDVPPLKYHVKSNIPFGCGCGSSSAAAVAGFLAAIVMTGHTLPTKNDEAMLQVISELEGHPDNAAPAIYGGIQMGLKGDRFSTYRVPTPPTLTCVLLIPIKKMKKNTHATRQLVPTELSMEDAVHNMGRTAVLTLALSTNQLHLLKNCLGDRMHQSQRAAALFPHMDSCIESAMSAGADYCFLSGAGPTICAFVSGRHGDLMAQPEEEKLCDKVAQAMIAAAEKSGVEARAVITHPSDLGAHVKGASGSSVNSSKISYESY